ncbi:hypothetical protein QYE76_013459 [Lolium multiflorum]|uniref:CCHC-type domain-containing protein n=1 Tax=Lolium multiflorum TaxID=4521 RepID=A0AAD8U2Z6_LOLMU|nr:hypothetical protein QYE76_013459 [Lolium multiflorum]
MIQLLQTMMADREAERAERQANLAALQQLAQNNQGHGNHDHPLRELKPQKVFATHYPVRTCKSLVDKCPCNECGTDDDMGRLLKFSKYHVPQGLIKKMRDEFRELKQGRMSVVEYRDRFLTQNDEPEWTPPYPKHRNNSSGGFTPRNNRPPAQTYRPNYSNNNGGPPKPGGNNNHNSHHNNGNNTNTNTGPRTGSNAIPVTPKDKSTINCYECGVVGHYSKECPKKLAKIATNTAASDNKRFAVEGTRTTTTAVSTT